MRNGRGVSTSFYLSSTELRIQKVGPRQWESERERWLTTSCPRCPRPIVTTSGSRRVSTFKLAKQATSFGLPRTRSTQQEQGRQSLSFPVPVFFYAAGWTQQFTHGTDDACSGGERTILTRSQESHICDQWNERMLHNTNGASERPQLSMLKDLYESLSSGAHGHTTILHDSSLQVRTSMVLTGPPNSQQPEPLPPRWRTLHNRPLRTQNLHQLLPST